jgi:hypothetical protein
MVAVAGLLLAAAVAAAPAVEVPPEAASAASAPPTHRPLRENQPPSLPEPTEPQVLGGYAGVAAFSVVPRKPSLALYPCSQCHKLLPWNKQPRLLVAAPHAASLQHGQGQFWCLDCHLGPEHDALHSVAGTRIDFDSSYLLCGQCHSARQRDWVFGAHGKRVANWRGDRELYSCTHCHDPHDPVILPRAPSGPPPLRAGLAPMARAPGTAVPSWLRTPRRDEQRP